MVARCAGYDCYPVAILSGGDGSGRCGMVTYCGLVVVLVIVSVVFMTDCCSFVAVTVTYFIWFGGVDCGYCRLLITCSLGGVGGCGV